LGARRIEDASADASADLSKNKGAEIALDLSAQFRRLSGAVRMIVPPALTSRAPSVNEPVLRAIARARKWYKMLVKGEVSSLHALGRSTGLNERYVSRVLRCAFLAPDIVKSIADGEQPEYLTLDRLMRAMPAAWTEQRARFVGLQR
jgi:hypothetical protein